MVVHDRNQEMRYCGMQELHQVVLHHISIVLVRQVQHVRGIVIQIIIIIMIEMEDVSQ